MRRVLLTVGATLAKTRVPRGSCRLAARDDVWAAAEDHSRTRLGGNWPAVVRRLGASSPNGFHLFGGPVHRRYLRNGLTGSVARLHDFRATPSRKRRLSIRCREASVSHPLVR